MENFRGHFLKTLQARINAAFLLIVGISVVSYMFISINQSEETVKETSTDYTKQLIQMVNENIESYVENMENIAQIVIHNSDVRSYLFTKYETGVSEEDYRTKVAEQFQTLKDTRDDIYNIGVLGADGRYLINDKNTQINTSADLSKTDWYQKALRGEENVTSSHVQNLVEGEYRWVVTLSDGIPNLIDEESGGVFFIDLNYMSISNLCDEINLGSRGYVFIIDEDGNLVYHPKQQLIYNGLWEEEIDSILSSDSEILYTQDGERLYTISKSDVTGWTVVGVSYLSEMLERTNSTRTVFCMIAITLIGFAMLLAIMLTDMVTHPLRDLRESMKEVENGNFDIEIPEPETEDEIGYLIRSFKIMIGKIRQLIERNKAEEREKRKSELYALQAQINPHFLYNTLDSIIWMAEGKKMKEVILMTSSLSKLLRKSISNQNEMVPISGELDYVDDYLKIQQMRYRDKLEYEISVDSQVRHLEIPKLVIQPLVENAIYHGIKLKEGKGTIQIRGFLEGNNAIIEVQDDGVGMEEETCTRILTDNDVSDANKVGVQNVHRRIKLYYGQEYGLNFTSILGKGTTVRVIIPFGGDDLDEE